MLFLFYDPLSVFILNINPVRNTDLLITWKCFHLLIILMGCGNTSL